MKKKCKFKITKPNKKDGGVLADKVRGIMEAACDAFCKYSHTPEQCQEQ